MALTHTQLRWVIMEIIRRVPGKANSRIEKAWIKNNKPSYTWPSVSSRESAAQPLPSSVAHAFADDELRLQMEILESKRKQEAAERKLRQMRRNSGVLEAFTMDVEEEEEEEEEEEVVEVQEEEPPHTIHLRLQGGLPARWATGAMSLCRELGQAGRLGWCAGCGGMLEGLVASKVSLVAVEAWAAAGGAGSGCGAGSTLVAGCATAGGELSLSISVA
eukprot:jgi/Tetstr1/455354/TSEL_042189.t1